MNYKFNDDQELRRYVMQEFETEDWEKAYNFLKSGESNNGSSKPRVINFNDETERYTDGVYVCYKSGRKEIYNGQNSTFDVSHIGIVMGSKMLGVALDDMGKYKFPRLDDENSFRGYVNAMDDALDDYAGKKKTERFREHLYFDITDEEWIPSVGELCIIFINKKLLNEALTYVGGDAIPDEIHWSVTEYSDNSAWYVNLRSVNLSYYVKGCLYHVRAVRAF